MRLGGLHARSRRCEALYGRCVSDMLSDEGVWAGYRRASMVCRVRHLAQQGKLFFFFLANSVLYIWLQKNQNGWTEMIPCFVML